MRTKKRVRNTATHHDYDEDNDDENHNQNILKRMETRTKALEQAVLFLSNCVNVDISKFFPAQSELVRDNGKSEYNSGSRTESKSSSSSLSSSPKDAVKTSK